MEPTTGRHAYDVAILILATGGGSGDGDGLDDGAAVVAASRRRSLISTWPNVARYHSRFWTGELRVDRCVFPVFRACAAP